MSKLLETFQELNLSNYGPDDVDQLNAWAIDAYAELAAPKTQEPVAEFFALDDGIGTIMAAWADGFEPVVGQKLYAAPVISAKQQVALPEWAPCNPGCDPEFNGQRSTGCARYCENARAAMLVAAPAPAPVSEAKAQEPDCDRSACGDFSPGPCDNPDCSARRDRTVVAPASPAADAGGVLEQAMYTLISIGYHENSGLVHELRQALAAHRAQGVV